MQYFRGCAEVSDTNGCINENGEVKNTSFIIIIKRIEYDLSFRCFVFVQLISVTSMKTVFVNLAKIVIKSISALTAAENMQSSFRVAYSIGGILEDRSSGAKRFRNVSLLPT